jgi:flagellar biosynthesis protein
MSEPKKVVGLQYEVGQGLPQVILKGSGPLAEEILRRRDPVKGPQVVKDEELLKKLYRLPLDAEIGPELYHLVAILLAHVFAIEEKLKGERK